MKVASSRKNLLLLDSLGYYKYGALFILNLGLVSSGVLNCKPTKDVMQEITLM